MAQSPAHRFGQMIGGVLESAVDNLLTDFAARHQLYLDRKGTRPARTGKKLQWTDSYGNSHDLDFVLEQNGTDKSLGTPIAFVEVAWRRYTKHSRNKAQEIQGAILPLRDANRRSSPLIAVVAAGEFTEDALSQLRSVGFHVAYWPYETVVRAFAEVGINALWEENTPRREFARRMKQWDSLSKAMKRVVHKKLIHQNASEIEKLMDALHCTASRTIASVRVLPLHGIIMEWQSIDEAISFIHDYSKQNHVTSLVRFEIEVVYSNGDKVSGEFSTKEAAIEFLSNYESIRK